MLSNFQNHRLQTFLIALIAFALLVGIIGFSAEGSTTQLPSPIRAGDHDQIESNPISPASQTSEAADSVQTPQFEPVPVPQ